VTARVRAVRAAVAVVAAALLLSTLGGCRVAAAPREPASTKVKDVLDSGHGRFDLTRPPSREEAGMPAGTTEVTYQRDDHKPFAVQVALPGGKELDVDARLLTFDALSEPDPASAPPTTMDIHYYPPTLEAGRDHLLTAARELGFDTGLITKWYEEATGPRPNQAPASADSPWLRTSVGYLRLDVQARYSPPVDTPQSDQTDVHYLLTWQPGTGPAPS
jgi:hypothetical protein